MCIGPIRPLDPVEEGKEVDGIARHHLGDDVANLEGGGLGQLRGSPSVIYRVSRRSVYVLGLIHP